MIKNMDTATLLIVDDSSENIKILLDLFRDEYKIKIANTGEKALRILLSDDLPDLILLDVLMPGMDGYEVCRNIKKDSRTCKIPIIFVTGKISDQDQIKGFEAGGVDYVCKPFNPIIVKARVETHVELKKQREFLEDISCRDGLTGIFNRRRFDEYLKQAWEVSCSEQSSLAIILIDVDYFKLFNDNYGHQEGDECLKNISITLANSLKRKIDLVARYGGEEFGCILPKTDIHGAVRVAEKFRENILSLQIPHAYSKASGYVTISQGVSATSPEKKRLQESLIKSADEALYRAKTGGRNEIKISTI